MSYRGNTILPIMRDQCPEQYTAVGRLMQNKRRFRTRFSVQERQQCAHKYNTRARRGPSKVVYCGASVHFFFFKHRTRLARNRAVMRVRRIQSLIRTRSFRSVLDPDVRTVTSRRVDIPRAPALCARARDRDGHTVRTHRRKLIKLRVKQVRITGNGKASYDK